MKQFKRIPGLLLMCLLFFGGWRGQQSVQADSVSETVEPRLPRQVMNLDDVA